MNFQVPQFIEVENKVFGPLSFTQFVFVAGGAAVAFLWYVILPSLIISLIPMLASVGAGFAFAFYKVNNRSLIYTVQSMVKYSLSKKLYLWQKEEKRAATPLKAVIAATQTEGEASIKRRSHLDQLSWSLDVKEKIR